MNAVNSTINYHGIKSISAYAHDYHDAPFRISLDGDGGLPVEMNMFLDDDVLTRRLVKAINDVCEERRKELRPVPVLSADEYQRMVEAESRQPCAGA